MPNIILQQQIPPLSFTMVKKITIGVACLVFASSPAFAAKKPIQTRVAWLAACPSDPAPVVKAESDRSAALGLIAAAMAPKLIDGAVDMAAEALKAAGQTKTFASTAKSDNYFYQVSQDADLKVAVNCLVVVRGVFDDTTSQHDLAEESDEFKGLQSVNFHLEARLKPLRGLKYFQLVPQYLEVSDFDQPSVFSRRKRDFIAAITLTVPGATEPFGSAEMTFKDVTRNIPLKGDDWRLYGAKSLPIAFPPESADATKAKEKREGQIAPYLLALDTLTPPKQKTFGVAPSVYEDKDVQNKTDNFCNALKLQNKTLSKEKQQHDDRCSYRLISARQDLDAALEIASRNHQRTTWSGKVCKYEKEDAVKKTAAYCSNQPADASLKGANFTYFTTQLSLSETREGSKFALYLGNALSASKEAVSAELQEKYLPKSKEMREAEKSAERDANHATLIADLEVIKAQEALAGELIQDPPVPVDVTSARIALLKAKIAANEAHRKAGTPVPFKNLTDV